MIILIDTVNFFWFVSGNSNLPPRTESEITNPQDDVFLSVGSLWEIILNESEALPFDRGRGVRRGCIQLH